MKRFHVAQIFFPLNIVYFESAKEIPFILFVKLNVNQVRNGNHRYPLFTKEFV
jgi:hypothetical protein